MRKTPAADSFDMRSEYRFDYAKAKPNRFAASSEVADLPVACTLTTPELHEREQTVLAKIRARIQEVRDLDSGYALRFAPEDAVLADLATLIDLERQCCPFLRFDLAVLPASGPIWLQLTGPEGTREFLRTVLDLP